MSSNMRNARPMYLAVTTIAVLASAGSAFGTILFEDHFDNGAMSPEWVSKMPSQWVEDGWLHNRDTDGWPRDAMATVHDSDPTWTDYEVSVRIDPLTDTSWDHANLLLRTDNFVRSSGPYSGRAYEMEFFGPAGFGFQGLKLHRSDNDAHESILLAEVPLVLPTDPFDVRVSLEGGHIQMWLEGDLMIDLVDPDPLLFGGIGVHNIWESETRYDDFVVTPEPATAVMALAALVLLRRR